LGQNAQVCKPETVDIQLKTTVNRLIIKYITTTNIKPLFLTSKISLLISGSNLITLNEMNMFKSIGLTVVIMFSYAIATFAGEGMWLPLLLKAYNEEEMQSMGMKMSAEDIYSVNQGSLKDAIVHFGGFCTSEVISDRGLLLTNHHCGYGQIQSHSTLENNYLKDGFWAMSQDAELANPGLYAKFIDRIIDVSDIVLKGAADVETDEARQELIKANIASYQNSAQLESYEEIEVKPFFNTNQYFAFVTVTYNDVRLVGAPPESIGKFGADTDNWEWPRHTGDFALFRIYAGPDNMPADYDEANKPYSPKHHLPISLDGVAEGDFTLIFGFPGRTEQYLPSNAVEQILEDINPARIAVRENTLDIVGKAMREDSSVKLKYASKFASIANYWKKWIGESQGLVQTNALAKKESFESELVSRNPEAKNILDQFNRYYSERQPYAKSNAIYGEVTGRNIELMRVAGLSKRLLNTYDAHGEEGYNSFYARLKPFLTDLYKNYDAGVDQKVFASLMELYRTNMSDEYLPSDLKSNLSSLASTVYGQSILTDGNKLFAALEEGPEAAKAILTRDKGFALYTAISDKYNGVAAEPYSMLNGKIDSLQRLYMKAQMDAFPDKNFYPDANSTMRVTYGQVNGYQPKDGVWYDPVTHLDGVVAKYVPGDYEFDVPAKLLELYEDKDYGQYTTAEGKIPVCFLGSNHTTGGNSGSPAIDANGNLIGLNFDRVWEGTMSDINYDKSICRNIMVDARYILFIVDKFAGATHLIDEMELVHPKEGLGSQMSDNTVNGPAAGASCNGEACCASGKAEDCCCCKRRLFKRRCCKNKS
jgi:hypothetical protein